MARKLDWTKLSDKEMADKLIEIADKANTALIEANQHVGNLSVIMKSYPHLSELKIGNYNDLHTKMSEYGKKLHEIKNHLRKVK